jgi:hypothetical protein
MCFALSLAVFSFAFSFAKYTSAPGFCPSKFLVHVSNPDILLSSVSRNSSSLCFDISFLKPNNCSKLSYGL